MWVQWACRSEGSGNGNVCVCLVSGCGVDSGHSGHGSMFVLSPPSWYQQPPGTTIISHRPPPPPATWAWTRWSWIEIPTWSCILHSAPRPQAGLEVYNQYGTNYDAVAVLCPCWPQLERAEQRISPEPRRHYLHSAVASGTMGRSRELRAARHTRGSRHTRP